MTRQEELREQYEDALFTLLMEEVAVAEGEEFLRESEALRGDPEAAVPEEVIKRCRRTINRCFSRQRRRSLARQFRWVFQKASVVALLGVLLFSAVYAISPEFRVGVLNLVVETLDESTDVSFMEDFSGEGNFLKIDVGWVPQGYTVFDEGSNASHAWKYFSNTAGKRISIDIMFSEGQLTSWDNDTLVNEPVVIGNYTGVFSIRDDVSTLSLIDFDRSITLTIWADDISKENLFRIAENLSF